MQEQTKKSESSSHAVANRVVQQKQQQQDTGFVDNRAEAVAQRQLQAMLARDPKAVLMRKSAGKTIKRPNPSPDWTNTKASPWPYLNVGGTAANDYGKKANLAVEGRGVAGIQEMMSAHLVPKRIGGKGSADNIVPWSRDFEGGIWEYQMERPFDVKVRALAPDEELGYAVVTDDLGSDKAQEFVDNNPKTQKSDQRLADIERISRVPTRVVGYIDGVCAVDKVFTQTWWNAKADK